MALSITLNSVKSNMEKLGLPAAVIAQLLAVKLDRSFSTSSLAAALRDAGRIEPKLEAELLTLTNRLIAHQEAFQPLQLPKSATELALMLESAHGPQEVEDFISTTFSRERKTLRVSWGV
jgi:hypothetical protein